MHLSNLTTLANRLNTLANRLSTLANRLSTLANWTLAKRLVSETTDIQFFPSSDL